MVFPQVIAGFHALVNVIGLPVNLLVIATTALERRFHVMRYILLASLAVSDFLLLILGNSFRIASIAKEKWLYGPTMCYVNAFSVRYFYLNTVLHLIAVSYERYSAIVKSPMTYDGTITKSRVVLMIFIWVAPIPLSIGPFVGWGQYVYNPDLFVCEQGWTVQSDSTAWRTAILAITTLVVPSLIKLFLNWSVLKTANTLQHNPVQVGDIGESQNLQEMSTRRIERKAAVDVCIIIAAFMVCFLPFWTVGMCRQFLNSSEVPAEFVLVANVIYSINALCNPIIYSIRKREFRAGVKNVFRRIGVCGSPNNPQNEVIGMNNFTSRANLVLEDSTERATAGQATQDEDERFYKSTRRSKVTFQKSRLSPIQEITE